MSQAENMGLAAGKNQLSKCTICGGEDFDFILEALDYANYCPVKFNLMRCRQCGNVSINPYPDKQYVYYQAAQYTNEPHKVDIYFNLLNPNRAKIVKRYKKSGRILDIGCGDGEFLSQMKNKGWEVFGIETSPDMFALIKSRLSLPNIYNDDLLSIDFPDKSFDVITLWHVIEHLERPVESFKKINRLLKDDGIVIIESPNFSSCQRKFFKDKWFALGVPRHINFFCPESLKKVLGLSGLRFIREDYMANPRVDFITFKKSLLRWLNLERVPGAQGINRAEVLVKLKRHKNIYRLPRVIFELFCLIFALLLSLINCGSTFRVYCRKAL